MSSVNGLTQGVGPASGAVGVAGSEGSVASVGLVVRLAWRLRNGYCRARVGGVEVVVRVPSAAGLAVCLRTVFFRAPVPSGCTLTLVLSNETASILICTT